MHHQVNKCCNESDVLIQILWGNSEIKLTLYFFHSVHWHVWELLVSLHPTTYCMLKLNSY